MSRRFWIAAATVLILAVPALVGVTWWSTSPTWKTLRTVKAAVDTLYSASTQKNDATTSADGVAYIHRPVGAVLIDFRGTAAADKTLAWCLWARKSPTDPAEYVAHGTATTGATQTGGTNEYYADTIVITDQQWYTTVKVVNDAPDTVINGGGIAKLAVDSCEYTVWELQITAIAGGGAQCATAGAEIQNFAL